MAEVPPFGTIPAATPAQLEQFVGRTALSILVMADDVIAEACAPFARHPALAEALDRELRSPAVTQYLRSAAVHAFEGDGEVRERLAVGARGKREFFRELMLRWVGQVIASRFPDIAQHLPAGFAASAPQDAERLIAYENATHWVRSAGARGFEVYRVEATASARVGIVGYCGLDGLDRAIAEADRRHSGTSQAVIAGQTTDASVGTPVDAAAGSEQVTERPRMRA